MTKTLLLVLVALLLVAVVPLAAAQEVGAVLEIPIDRDAYNAEISADAHLAAIYAGRETLALLGVPIIEYQPDPALLAIRLMDLDSGERVATLVGPTDYVSDVAFTPDGTRLATYHRNGDLYLWETASGRELKRIIALIGDGQIEFLADGRTLVVHMGGTYSQFAVWDVDAGVMTAVWRPHYDSFGDLKLGDGLGRLDHLFTAFDVTPDGTLLATATPNGEVALWDTATMEPTIVRPRSAEPGRFEVRWLAFSADGGTLAYADGGADQIHLWDVATGRDTRIDADSPFPALAPAGDQLAWWADGTVRVAVAGGAGNPVPVFTVPAGLEGVLARSPLLTFAPDGTRLVVSALWRRDDDVDNRLYVVTLP